MYNTQKSLAEMDSPGKLTIGSTIYKTIGFQKVLSRSRIRDIHTSQFHMDVGLFRG